MTEIYEDWYVRRNKEADADTVNGELASFTVRLSDYAKKIAILVEISRKDNWSDTRVRIQPQSMEYALKLCDWLIKTSQFVLGEVDQNEMSVLEQKICQLIQEAGADGVLHRDIRHRFKRNSKTEVEIAIDSLIDAEKITCVLTNTTGKGRSGKKYIYGVVKS